MEKVRLPGVVRNKIRASTYRSKKQESNFYVQKQ